MACVNCDEFTCVEPMPTGLDFINIGFPISALTNTVTIYVRKLINGETLSRTQTIDGYSPGIMVDMSDPREAFYNEDDGVYVMWATDFGAHPEDALTVELDSGQYTKFGVEFLRTKVNNISTLEVIPIV